MPDVASLRPSQTAPWLPAAFFPFSGMLDIHDSSIPISPQVIHESWPQDQLDYYAKEVFMCKDISAATIREAFSLADTIVFPSSMQRSLYDGMYRPGCGITVYNGIPLQKLDAFKRGADRKKVRGFAIYFSSCRGPPGRSEWEKGGETVNKCVVTEQTRVLLVQQCGCRKFIHHLPFRSRPLLRSAPLWGIRTPIFLFFISAPCATGRAKFTPPKPARS